VPCVELIWSRRGRSIFTGYMSITAVIIIFLCVYARGIDRYALWGVLVCMTLVDDVICAVDGFHRLER
jgi:hypothetical protein